MFGDPGPGPGPDPSTDLVMTLEPSRVDSVALPLRYTLSVALTLFVDRSWPWTWTQWPCPGIVVDSGGLALGPVALIMFVVRPWPWTWP